MNGEGAGAAWEEDDEFDGSYVDVEGDGNDNGDDPAGRVSSSPSSTKQAKSESHGGKESPSSAHDKKSHSRHGRWESGKGRCPVTGRRVLGGTEGLRRVLV
jgi:peroxin-12